MTHGRIPDTIAGYLFLALMVVVLGWLVRDIFTGEQQLPWKKPGRRKAFFLGTLLAVSLALAQVLLDLG